MKIFAFADLHSDFDMLRKIKNNLKKQTPEVIICAGDISEFGDSVLEMISEFKNCPYFLIIPGNHENPRELSDLLKGKNAIDMHNKSLKIGEILFVGHGSGGISLFDSGFEKISKSFENKIKNFRKHNQNPKVVLITHAPPFNTELDNVYEEHVGSESIRNFIEKIQPDLCICGHIHETAGKEDTLGKTKLINPGKKGKLIYLV